MTNAELKALVQLMKTEGVMVFEAHGVKVQFAPRAVADAMQLTQPNKPESEATQSATKNTPTQKQFDGMDVTTLLGLPRHAHLP